MFVHTCPECDEEFQSETDMVDHLNDAHDYGWSYEEYHKICGYMNREWRSPHSLATKVIE